MRLIFQKKFIRRNYQCLIEFRTAPFIVSFQIQNDKANEAGNIMGVRHDGRMSLLLSVLCRGCILMENSSDTATDTLPRKRYVSRKRTPEVSEISTILQKLTIYLEDRSNFPAQGAVKCFRRFQFFASQPRCTSARNLNALMQSF